MTETIDVKWIDAYNVPVYLYGETRSLYERAIKKSVRDAKIYVDALKKAWDDFHAADVELMRLDPSQDVYDKERIVLAHKGYYPAYSNATKTLLTALATIREAA